MFYLLHILRNASSPLSFVISCSSIRPVTYTGTASLSVYDLAGNILQDVADLANITIKKNKHPLMLDAYGYKWYHVVTPGW